MPLSFASSETLVPGRQCSLGRQSTLSLPDQSRIQPQEPSVLFEVVTLSCFSTCGPVLHRVVEHDRQGVRDADRGVLARSHRELVDLGGGGGGESRRGGASAGVLRRDRVPGARGRGADRRPAPAVLGDASVQPSALGVGDRDLLQLSVGERHPHGLAGGLLACRGHRDRGTVLAVGIGIRRAAGTSGEQHGKHRAADGHDGSDGSAAEREARSCAAQGKTSVAVFVAQ